MEAPVNTEPKQEPKEPVINGVPTKEPDNVPGVDVKGDAHMSGVNPHEPPVDPSADDAPPSKKARGDPQAELEDVVVAGILDALEEELAGLPLPVNPVPVNPFTAAQIEAAGGEKPLELVRMEPYTLWGLSESVYLSGTPGLPANKVLFRCTQGRVASADTLKKEDPSLDVAKSTLAVTKVTSSSVVGYLASTGGHVEVMTFEAAWRRALQSTHNACNMYNMLTCNIREHSNTTRCIVTSKHSLVWLPRPEACAVRALIEFEFNPWHLCLGSPTHEHVKYPVCRHHTCHP